MNNLLSLRSLIIKKSAGDQQNYRWSITKHYDLVKKNYTLSKPINYFKSYAPGQSLWYISPFLLSAMLVPSNISIFF